VYTYQKEKFNLTFLFSPFRFYIDTKMYLHGFQERMFSIQEQCSQFKNNVPGYFSLWSYNFFTNEKNITKQERKLTKFMCACSYKK